MRELTIDETMAVFGGQDTGGGGGGDGGGGGGDQGGGGSGWGDGGGGDWGGGGGNDSGGPTVGWNDFPISEPGPNTRGDLYPPIDAEGPEIRWPDGTTVNVGVTDDGGGGVRITIPF
jgi:hypothetical protein